MIGTFFSAAALVATMNSTQVAISTTWLTNGRIEVRNALDSKAEVRIHTLGAVDYNGALFPGQQETFARCCWVAGTTYLVNLNHQKYVSVGGNGNRVEQDGGDFHVTPRLCSQDGLLYGYAHMTIRDVSGKPKMFRDDTRCP
jgi:hypothetical protein